MVSIILCQDEDSKQVALTRGFTEQIVLIRYEPGVFGDDEQAKIEAEIVEKIRPFQFLVSDYWGASVE